MKIRRRWSRRPSRDFPGCIRKALRTGLPSSANRAPKIPIWSCPTAQHAEYEESFARFAKVFPDGFYVSERGRYFPDDSTG